MLYNGVQQNHHVPVQLHRAVFSKEFSMSSNNNQRPHSDISWPLVIIAFAVFWPVGAFLLFSKLKEESANQDWQNALDEVKREARHVRQEFQKDFSDLEQQARRYAEPGHSHYYQSTTKTTTTRTTTTTTAHRYSQHSTTQRMGETPNYTAAPKKKSKIKGGKALMIAGACIAALFGIGALDEMMFWLPNYPLEALQNALVPFVFSGIGAGTFIWGVFKNRRARRFRKLLNMIGDSKRLDIQALAEAVPCSYNQACDNLQSMIDKGLLGTKAYIDMATGYLVMDGKGVGERKARKKEAPAKQTGKSQEEQILAEIRQVNEDIPDPELSRKIDRIEEITRHILEHQKKHPEKAGELHKFLNYYLPTTLKILNSYAELDRQGIDGSNISTTKERISGMMDQIVEGFETQLDKLFEGDMMDISSDISVMEKMLSHDGLAGGMRMPKAEEEPAQSADGAIHLTLDPEGTVRPAPAAEPAPAADSWTEPVMQPMPAADGGIQLTLTPEGDPQGETQSAPSWEDGFYRRTKEDLEQQN